MKNKIEITSLVDLDEIIYELSCELTPTQLVKFCLEIGTNLSDSEEFYLALYKEVNKIVKDLKNG